MPTQVVCDCRSKRLHHYPGNLHDAVRRVSAGKTLGVCKSGRPFRVVAHQLYPNSGKSDDLELVKAVAIDDPDVRRYEPYLLLLRRKRDGSAELWPIYWTKVGGRWKYGQYAPLIQPKGLEKAFVRIKS